MCDALARMIWKRSIFFELGITGGAGGWTEAGRLCVRRFFGPELGPIRGAVLTKLYLRRPPRVNPDGQTSERVRGRRGREVAMKFLPSFGGRHPWRPLGPTSHG